MYFVTPVLTVLIQGSRHYGHHFGERKSIVFLTDLVKTLVVSGEVHVKDPDFFCQSVKYNLQVNQ